MDAVRVLDERQILGESPVWCVREQALWWVDIRAPAVHRFEPASGRAQRWPVDELVGGVVLSDAGGVLIAKASGIARLDPRTGTITPVVVLARAHADDRLNETKVDRRGRLWTTSMRDFGAAVAGALYRIDSPSSVTRVVADLCVPNALAWSPDERTMYFADSADGRLRAYEFDADRGAVRAMRVLVDAGIVPGRPDGATVDVDGCVWNARYGGGCVARIAADGRIDRVVALPVSQPTSCAFGDADLRTLYVTTARQRLDDEALRREPDAGALFAIRTDVAGLPEPRCRF